MVSTKNTTQRILKNAFPKSIRLIIIFPVIFIAVCLDANAQNKESFNEAKVISWIEKNAIPIKTLKANGDYQDLMPLKKVFRDVRVIGSAEANHGTSEAFIFEHRLFEFLVKELQFNAVVIESSAAQCEPINDFVLHGKGSLEDVVTGQGYSVWDTQEMTNLIKWMRDYNQNKSLQNKVKFFGVDISHTEVARNKLKTYIAKYIPSWEAKLDPIFNKIAEGESTWPLNQKEELIDKASSYSTTIQSFIDYLNDNSKDLISKSSSELFNSNKYYAQLVKQFLQVSEDGELRRQFMGKNLVHLINQDPELKALVLAHWTHIYPNQKRNNLGYQVKERLGNEYYTFRFICHEGSFQTREWDQKEKVMDQYNAVKISSASDSSHAHNLNKIGASKFFLDFRHNEKIPEVATWLETPKYFVSGSWLHNSKPYNTKGRLDMFDGIMYIEHISPSTPTTNALKPTSRY